MAEQKRSTGEGVRMARAEKMDAVILLFFTRSLRRRETVESTLK